VERRRFPRQDVQGMSLKVGVVINGGSLISHDTPRAIEIQAQAINLSRSGICLTLVIDAIWQTIMPHREVTLVLERGPERQSLKAEVVRVQSKKHMMIGLKFPSPFSDMSKFLIPEELEPYN